MRGHFVINSNLQRPRNAKLLQQNYIQDSTVVIYLYTDGNPNCRLFEQESQFRHSDDTRSSNSNRRTRTVALYRKLQHLFGYYADHVWTFSFYGDAHTTLHQ